MIECNVMVCDDVMYCNGFSISRGYNDGYSHYFVENSDGYIVLDYSTLEQCFEYCMKNGKSK